MRHVSRPTAAALLILVFCATVAAGYPVENQILTNPGFDLDEDEDGVPDGWNTSPDRAVLREIVFMGGNNALVSVGDTYVLATQDIALEPGETYTISFRARGSGGGVAGALLLHGEDRPTREMPVLWNVTLDEDYTEFGRAFEAPNPVARLYIYNLAREGEVAYDWVSITKGEPSRSWVNTFSFGERNTPVTEPIVRERIMRWANPLAGGAVRALIDVYSYRPVREVVELAQRFEMDYDVIDAGYTGDAIYSTDGRRVMRTMDEGGYEVYFIGGRLDEMFEASIREKVEAGAGLVVISGLGRLGNYCSPDDLEAVAGDHYIMRDLPWDHMPAHILEEVRVGRIGEGTVVWLNFPSDRSRVWGVYPVESGYAAWTTRQMRYWEYWYAFMARAIHYAARGEGAIILSEGPDAVRVAGAPEGATVEITPRHTRELRWGEPEPTAGPRTVPAEAPFGVGWRNGFPDGDVLYDLTVRDEAGAALYWGSLTAAREQVATIGDIELSAEFYEPGETIAATLSVEQPPANATLHARLIDGWDRVIAETAVPAEADTALTLAPPAEQVLTTGHKLFVKLLLDEREIDSAWTDVYFPAINNTLPLQDWHISAWGDGMTNPFITHQYSRMLMELGFDGKFGSAPYMTAETPMISATHSQAGRAFTGSPAIEDGVRDPCLSDPEVIESYLTAAPEEIAANRRFGPFAVNVRDEATLANRHTRREVCFSERCRARYHDWLRAQYADIAALNARWGTDYADFDEIVGATTEDVRGGGNFAPFVDFRTFMTDVWVEGMREITEAYEDAWPDIRVGHTNTFGAMPTNGNDFWKLCTQTGFEWAQEYSEAIKGTAQKAVFELWRSFWQGRTGENVPNYGWIGYDHRPEAVMYEPWWLALHDSGGVTYYATNAVAPERGKSWALIHPTQAYTPYSLDVRDALTDLREGIGKTLIEARRADPDVAILWSHPSMLVAWCESDWTQPEPPETAVDDSYGSWFKSAFYFRLALQELQLMYNYVAPEQILGGELDRYTLLFLPMTSAISDELAEVLLAWVEGGGTLVADHRFAITDERGTPRDDDLLERLFGVRRAQHEAIYEAATLTGPGGQAFVTSAREIIEPTADAETNATYDDGTPAAIFREVGDGQTVYLNCLLPKYDEVAVYMIEALMQAAGVERRVVVRGPDPETAARAWECAEYELGEARVVGLIRDHRLADGPQTCEVGFDRPAHIYDMRGREHLGETQTATLTLGRGETAMLALLPYEVTGIEITGDGPVLRATVQADGDLTDHVLRVTVTDPRGVAAPAYARNVLAAGGAADLRIPLALSDAAGEWTVTVRDVLSGVEASAGFTWQAGG